MTACIALQQMENIQQILDKPAKSLIIPGGNLPTQTPDCDTYITGVDKPGDLAIGCQLPIDIAADLAVLPAIVDVNDRHHVPLKNTNTRNLNHTNTFSCAQKPSVTLPLCNLLNRECRLNHNSNVKLLCRVRLLPQENWLFQFQNTCGES